MSLPEVAITLAQLVDHANEAIGMCRGRTRRDLSHDRLFALALERLVSIIGEAAGRLPSEFRDRHPGIPWADIIGMRHRLVHGYEAVDYDIVWEALTVDLSPVARDLEAPLRNLNR